MGYAGWRNFSQPPPPSGKPAPGQKAAAAPLQTIVDLPRNELPLDEYTQYYVRKNFTLENGNIRRVMTYFWLEPEKPYPEGVKFPLVVILHGGTGRAYAGKYLLSPENRIKYPAFVLVPISPSDRPWAWWEGMRPGDSLPDTITLLRQVMQEHPVDSSRIYVMGCSEGGFGAFAAALHHPDLFAAAVPMSSGWNPAEAPRITKVPIWAFHGALDESAPVQYTRDAVKLIHQNGGKIYYTEFRDMYHECPSPRLYTDRVWQWLFDQKKLQ